MRHKFFTFRVWLFPASKLPNPGDLQLKSRKAVEKKIKRNQRATSFQYKLARETVIWRVKQEAKEGHTECYVSTYRNYDSDSYDRKDCQKEFEEAGFKIRPSYDSSNGFYISWV